MAASAPPPMTLEALRSVPLFSSLDDEAARALRGLLDLELKAAGDVLFHAGDAGDALYLIEGGRVRIHIRDADGDDVTLAELSRGDFFGEMSILDGKPRSAQATVTDDACLAVLSRGDFLSFVRANPDVALRMMSAITERLRRTDELLRQRVSRNLNEMERERLTMADRIADVMAEFGGSWKFIFITLLLLAFWIPLNAWYLSPESRLDPWPYDMLALFLGVVAGLQVPFILMSQNRQEEKDRLRADLDYQVNLKNELAIAEVLRRLDVLESERLPILFAEQNARVKEAFTRRQQEG
jgi:CRP/FNR family cyclic AMP-dependent transcriptional regulator